MHTIRILSKKGITISDKLMEVIIKKFRIGGNDRFQINDVIEWIGEEGPLMVEADRLLTEYGEFYIERSSVMGDE